MRPTVYLTGFMGTGKSVVGRELGRLLRRPFSDLDAEIERGAKMSVADIFKTRGESAFRRLERLALARAARRDGGVVALGGGALLDARSRALVARTGVLVRLTCERRELVRRLRRSRAERPLLAGGRLNDRVASLLAARRAVGGVARWTVSTTRRSPRAVASLLARKIS